MENVRYSIEGLFFTRDTGSIGAHLSCASTDICPETEQFTPTRPGIDVAVSNASYARTLSARSSGQLLKETEPSC